MTTSLAIRAMSEHQRFEQYVYPDPNSGCFIWAGATDRKGYGVFATGKRPKHRAVRAHRYAWTLSGRDLPLNACLLHKCDTPCCVNPDHLFLGTRADNNLDMSRKGRGYKGSGKLPFGVQAHPSGRYSVVVWDGARMAFYGMFEDLAEAAAKAVEARNSRIARDEQRKRAEQRIWTQRDGTPIAVKDMTDHHLLAASAMLRRKGFIGPRTLAAYLGPGPTADAASLAFDAEQREAFEAPISAFVDIFDDEIKRRGLLKGGA